MNKKQIIILSVILLFEALILVNFSFSTLSFNQSENLNYYEIEKICSNKTTKCTFSPEYKNYKDIKNQIQNDKNIKINVGISENYYPRIILELFFVILLAGFLIYAFIQDKQKLSENDKKNNYKLIALLSLGVNINAFHLYSNNFFEISHFAFLVSIFSISILFFISYFLLKTIFKNGYSALSINFFIFSILMMYQKFIPFENFFETECLIGDIYLFIGFIVLACTLILLLNTKKIVIFLKYFTISFLILSILNCCYQTRYEILAQFKEKTYANKIKYVENDELNKNIYIILLDMYSGDKTLKYLGFDNKDFYSELEKRKFKVYKDMQSNYNRTAFSLNSFLNFDYAENLPYNKFEDGIKNALMFKILRKNGYKIFYINPTNLRFSHKDFDYYFVNNEPKEKLSFHYLFKNSAFSFITSKINTTKETIEKEKENGKNFLDISLEIKADKKMIFAHFLMPHHPYYKDENGNNNELMFDRIIDEKTGENIINKEKYIPYLKYSSKESLKMIDKILQKDKNSIIILMGDHGVQTRYFTDRKDAHEKEMKEDKMAIFAPFNTFLAYYNPDLKEEYYKNIDTLVNFSRAFSNENFKTNFKLLKNLKFYYHDWGWKGGIINAPGFYVD